MTIHLEEVVPSFFEKDSISGSEIWGKKILFEQGTHVHIVAPSGSGKTSLMHFIYGLRKDYSGVLSYDTTNISGFDLEQFSTFRQKEISIVFQDMRLFMDQTIRQNIEIKRQLSPYHPPEKIIEMANRLGIGSKLDRITNSCSYGEKQRVAIIRSLMQTFKYLLLDEPFSNLDTILSEKLFAFITNEVRKHKTAVILITHLAEEALKYADTLAVMDDGRILQMGKKWQDLP